MGRARLLAGAAAMATALMSTQASAFVGPCSPFGYPGPTPCIVADAQKVVEQIQTVRDKIAELEHLRDQVTQFTSIQGTLGAIGLTAKPIIGSVQPLAPMPRIGIEEAASAFAASLPKGQLTTAQAEAAKAEDRIRVRSVAGDGYAIALAMKGRLQEMDRLAATIQTSADATGGEDMRSDWQVNNQAKNLMLQGMAALKEIQAARTMLAATSAISGSQSGLGGDVNVPRGAATITVAAVTSDTGAQLTSVANLSNKLATLVNARQYAESFLASMQSLQESRDEYDAILTAARAADAQVDSIAAYDARRKGIPAARLIARADEIMAERDETVWDDPSKESVAESAAGYAESQLDRLVSGDVSNSWSDYLRTRAEARKEEAFFRPLNDEVIATQESAREALAEFEKSIGFGVTDLEALDARIAEAKQQVTDAGNALSEAPAEIKSQRDLIYTSTLEGYGYAGLPDWKTVDPEN